MLRPSTCEFTWSGGTETLEPQIVQVLLALTLSGGRVVSRDTLVEQYRGGSSVSQEAINRVISRIRRLSEHSARAALAA